MEFSCLQLGENSELGKPYNAIGKDLFGPKSGRHIIFYKLISANEIEVIRILHEQMDLENRLTEYPSHNTQISTNHVNFFIANFSFKLKFLSSRSV